jgi:acylphosphatase
MSESAERLEAVARGVVQGVGFRWYVVREAARLALTGWVANESDGSLRVVAEGSPSALAELEGALRRGPSGADVRSLDVSRGPAAGSFSRFEVRASGHRGD